MTLEPHRLCHLYFLVLLVTAYLVIYVPRIGLENFRYDSLLQPPSNKTTATQGTAAAENRTNITNKSIAATQAQQEQQLWKQQKQQQSQNKATAVPAPEPIAETKVLNQTNNVTMIIPPNNNNNNSISKNTIRLPRRHVALLGPHDRFNFGDLLFEKVVSKLLQNRAGYLPEELHAVGLINVNMSKYGGHEHIISIPDVIDLSQQAPKALDIIYLGGEALGCNHACGVRMLPTVKQQQEAKLLLLGVVTTTNCAYLFPKQLLVRNSNTKNNNNTAAEHGNNVAIVNSPGMGGSTNRTRYPCMDALDQADYISFRDLNTSMPHPYYPEAQLRPDSAVLTQQLFQDEIAEAAQRYLVPAAGLLDQPYLAVQIKSSLSMPAKQIAAILNKIQKHTNFTIVFFRAGSTWGHDSLDFYRNITQHLNHANSTTIFTIEHVWAVVALIQQAAAVLSTSLHVRIMAFVHQRPRVTWCSGAKHVHFVQLWEAVDHDDSCIMVKSGKIKSRTWPTLQASLVSSTTTNHTQVAVQRAIDSYLEGFDTWSKLLNRP